MYIIFKLRVFSYPFLSYVNWSFVEENETMSKINVLLCMHQSCNHEFDKGLELKTGQVCT